MHFELNLNQKMSLSPKMLQSVEILQLNSQELLKYVRQLADENPVVEIDEPTKESDSYEILKRKLEWLQSANEGNRVYNREFEDSEEDSNIAQYVSVEDEDLYQNLKSQLNLMNIPDNIRTILNYMIKCINEKGYLEDDISEIAQRLNIDIALVKEALSILQSIEPAGIGARDLRECLLLQLKRLNENNSVVIELVNNYLEMLSKNRLEVISKELGVSIDEVKNAYKVIKTLNPRPGISFGYNSQTQYLTPDLIVVKFSDYYEVLINDYFQPQISISRYYQNILKQNLENEVKEYISKKIKEADWIINCISQRNSTLLKVTRMIVEQQRMFFDKGPRHLAALYQQKIANDLGVHESTVSRAISGKYLQCSWGIFGLDHFFTNGLSIGDESQITPENVKLEIKEIIAKEDRRKPYSDQKITDLLQQKGINIARRTVTKYREEMNIQKTTLRKEY